MSTTTQKQGSRGQHAGANAARRPIASQPPTEAPNPAGEITRERIQARAYQIYQARIGSAGAGDAASDWLQAERELKGSTPDPLGVADMEKRARARGERLLAGGE
jgi:hypothetical protein